MKTRAEHVTKYESLGYVEMETDSGTGSRVLVNSNLGRVAKLNEDYSYDKFINLARRSKSPHFPQVHLHRCYKTDTPFEDWYTVTEMELLVPLTVGEGLQIRDWYNSLVDYVRTHQATEGAPDSVGLLGAYNEVRECALENNICIDMGKLSNYMVRVSGDGRVYVITDPLHSKHQGSSPGSAGVAVEV